MLSAQINELRGWANQLSEQEDEFGVVVRALVVALRDAADTIDGLRTRCQDVQRDYDNLRNAMWNRANARAIDLMTEDELRGLCTDLYDHIDELKALIRDMWHGGMCYCDEYGACEKCEYGYLDRARDLGVEVNEWPRT